MKQIDKNNKIFSLEEFQKDKYKFFIVFQILSGESPLIYSDEETYFACRTAQGYPTWIWTKEGIAKEKIKEIEELMTLFFTDNEKDKFTCRKEIYDMLIEDGFNFLNKSDYFEMGTLCCKQTKKPKQADGNISTATMQDKDLITTYWFNDCKEMNGIDSITMEKAESDAIEMINSDKFFVWRNNNGKIVSMANYKKIEDGAKLAHVYTAPEERSKGYAANLIYEMTEKILQDGLVPLLYTDYNYPASNKAYINAGFEDTGILINFSCSKEK